MGYRGKIDEQNRARDLRARGMTLLDIATEVGVAKSSVSLWVRDVRFTPLPRRTGARQREPNVLQRRKAAEIEALLNEGRERVGTLSEREFLADRRTQVASTALPPRRPRPRGGDFVLGRPDCNSG